MILILTNKWDISCDFVVMELRRRGHAFLRVNTEDLASARATVSLPDFHIYLTRNHAPFDLSADVKVIWNRRPGKPFDGVPREQRPSLATQRFVADQWYSWLESLQLIPNVRWINHPHANDAMESKIRQLFLAKSVGFDIPETWVSNDPELVSMKMGEFQNGIVAKALYSPLIEEPEADSFIFSNRLKSIAESDYGAVSVSPAIFQEALTPKVDYRVTVVGDDVLTVRIEMTNHESSEEIDWRAQKDGVRFTRCELPQEIERLCRSYVKESGLLFGAIDLVKKEDRYVFLEINPNGEWGWLQKPHNIPIAEKLCDLMISADSGN